jgi:hypothetical protein
VKENLNNRTTLSLFERKVLKAAFAASARLGSHFKYSNFEVQLSNVANSKTVLITVRWYGFKHNHKKIDYWDRTPSIAFIYGREVKLGVGTEMTAVDRAFLNELKSCVDPKSIIQNFKSKKKSD